MLRGAAKGALLGGIGWMPRGSTAYQTVTRDWMGTQATHVDKLARVWPGYAETWSSRAGLELEGLRIWVHDGGWTPFPLLANHLLTGRAGEVTNVHARMLDRYLARAVNGALGCDLSAEPQISARRPAVEALRWYDRTAEAIGAIGGRLHEGVKLDAVPLESESVDLCHSGGSLEHVEPSSLQAFLAEAFRVVRPGGVMSHVIDHRDHLHHADPSWPFLGHLRLSPIAYRLLCGNRLMYHNRLLPSEVKGYFESSGFEEVAVRRMTLPDRRYVDNDEHVLTGQPGLSRSALASRFSAASDVDLRTAAAHYLYRKPSR